MHIFHSWSNVYTKKISDSSCWFEHIKCHNCSKEKVVGHSALFSSLPDAMELGIEVGKYLKSKNLQTEF